MEKDRGSVYIRGSIDDIVPLIGVLNPDKPLNKAQPSNTPPSKPKLGVIENLKNVKKNWSKIKGSPFAALSFSLKVRKVIIGLLIAYISWSGFWMVWNFRADGFMNTVGKAIMAGIIAYVCWILYKSIDSAKKQLEYYKRNPHLINYTPVDAKTTVDEIIAKIEENKKQKGGIN